MDLNTFGWLIAGLIFMVFVIKIFLRSVSDSTKFLNKDSMVIALNKTITQTSWVYSFTHSYDLGGEGGFSYGMYNSSRDAVFGVKKLKQFIGKDGSWLGQESNEFKYQIVYGIYSEKIHRLSKVVSFDISEEEYEHFRDMIHSEHSRRSSIKTEQKESESRKILGRHIGSLVK